MIIRVLADPQNPGDLKIANALQDAIQVEQTNSGTFAVPHWDLVAQKKRLPCKFDFHASWCSLGA